MNHFPIFLDLEGRPVLVVGTAPAAAAKAGQLARAGAAVRQTGGLDGIGDAVLVVCADADEALGISVAAAARARGVPVNVVDRPGLCDFVWPAIVERGPITVAISTAGTSPVLARRLRARIEALVPQAFGRLATFAGDLRARVARAIPDPAMRRRFWEAAFDGRIGELVLAGREPDARTALDRALLGAGGITGRVSFVDAQTGDPEMLTLKALRRLQEADAIVYDSRVHPRIADLARRDAARIPAGEASLPAALARAGRRIVRLTAGDISAEVATLAAAGVPHDIVPGIAVREPARPTRATAALAVQAGVATDELARRRRHGRAAGGTARRGRAG